MKFVFSIILSVCIFGTSIHAQNDAKAKSVLDKVSQFYKNQKSISADFSLNIKNDDADINETQSGALILQGESYKITTDQIVRVCNGSSIWTHFIDDEEIQITDYDPEEEEMTPAKLFTIYEEGYTYSYVENTGGNDIIDLIPDDTDSPYFKIRLSVNSSNYIESAMVFSNNGTIMTYNIIDMQVNKAASGDYVFEYDVSNVCGDCEVVDLRF